MAKDASRPFIVEAGGGETRAIGTEFDIDIRPENVAVTVTEGIVGVSNSSKPIEQDSDSVQAVANQRVTYQADKTPTVPEDIDAEMETAWLRGKLIFNSKPLGEVVAALSRYQSGKIFIANSRLRSLNVTGVLI